MPAKAQIFTWDLIIASTFFIAVLFGLLTLWEGATTMIADSELKYELSRLATLNSEQLVRTPGYPVDWRPSDVVVFGLAESKDQIGFESYQDRLIDPDKFLYFVNKTYNEYDTVKGITLRSGEYDFFVDFRCKQDSSIECFEGLYASDIISGTVTCANGMQLIITNHVTDASTSGDYFCRIGQHISQADAVYLIPDQKNAVFNELLNLSDPLLSERTLNKSFDVTFVVYKPSPYI
ncbi:MAG: hypothetical protein V1921_09210 [Candidatus Altiarchaeota archaeon]